MQKEQNNEQHNTQAEGLVLPNALLGGGCRMYFISISTHPPPPPTQRTYLFFLQLTLHLPLKNTIKYGSTPEEYATPQESCENRSFILKEFHIFFTLALKKSSILITCPWRIPDH